VGGFVAENRRGQEKVGKKNQAEVKETDFRQEEFGGGGKPTGGGFPGDPPRKVGWRGKYAFHPGEGRTIEGERRRKGRR